MFEGLLREGDSAPQLEVPVKVPQVLIACLSKLGLLLWLRMSHAQTKTHTLLSKQQKTGSTVLITHTQRREKL